MISNRYIFMVLLVVLMINGCKETDEVTEFNKPAFYWYEQIATAIMTGRIDKADAYYISLKSEHIHSPLLPTALMMLAGAHMEEEEYLLANFYLDEYNKLFADYQSREYIDFLKLKASFLGIKDVYKDQKLMMDTIVQAKTYTYRYPNSIYLSLIDTMWVKLKMSQYLLNENIALLYSRIGKPKASKIYREKNINSVVELTDIKPPHKNFIAKIFD